MTLSRTSRGFSYDSFLDSKGTECSIQESSLATESAIWFGLSNYKPTLNGEPVPDPVAPIPIDGYPGLFMGILINDRMHLTKIQAIQLILDFEKYLLTKEVKSRNFKDRNSINCSIKLTDGLIELGCDDANPQILNNGWRPVVYPIGTEFNLHMFLGFDEVNNLLTLLKNFVETGYLDSQV